MDARTAWSLGLLTTAMLAMASGCAKLDLKPAVPFALPWEEKPQVPEKLVAFWTDTILYQPNQPPIRGFGGRLMFYGPNSSKPIKVSGELVVYAFDEEGRGPSDVKPDRKYVFPRDQFARHYSDSKLGHSYSVWIPWDEAGGPQKEISLIARFVPDEGPVLVGEQARQVLPGPVLADSQPAATADEPSRNVPASGRTQRAAGAVRAVAYESVALPPQEPSAPAQMAEGQSPDDAPARMSTMTISLPPRFSGGAPALTDSRAINATAGQPALPGQMACPGQIAAGPLLPPTGFAPRAEQLPPDCPPNWAAPKAEQTGQRSRDRWDRPTLPRSTHYSPPRFPVQARPAAQPTAARALWQPPR